MESDGTTLTHGHKGLEGGEGGFRRRQRYKNLSCVLSLTTEFEEKPLRTWYRGLGDC